MRNELLHPTRAAQNDPDNPGTFGLLILGYGSTAPEDAAGLIQTLEPGWMPPHVPPLLGLT